MTEPTDDLAQDDPDAKIAILARKLAQVLADDNASIAAQFVALMMAATGFAEGVEENFNRGQYQDHLGNTAQEVLDSLTSYGQSLWHKAKATMLDDLQVDPNLSLTALAAIFRGEGH